MDPERGVRLIYCKAKPANESMMSFEYVVMGADQRSAKCIAFDEKLATDFRIHGNALSTDINTNMFVMIPAAITALFCLARSLIIVTILKMSHLSKLSAFEVARVRDVLRSTR